MAGTQTHTPQLVSTQTIRSISNTSHQQCLSFHYGTGRFLSFRFLFLFACSFGVGVLRSCLPASLCRAPIDGPSFPPSDAKDHTLCVVRALVPTLAVLPPHVCHRQRDWAVSIGSHMQQDMGVTSTPPHLDSPFPLFDAVRVRKRRSEKLATVSPETELSFVNVPTRVFRPAGRHLYRITHTCTCKYSAMARPDELTL